MWRVVEAFRRAAPLTRRFCQAGFGLLRQTSLGGWATTEPRRVWDLGPALPLCGTRRCSADRRDGARTASMRAIETEPDREQYGSAEENVNQLTGRQALGGRVACARAQLVEAVHHLLFVITGSSSSWSSSKRSGSMPTSRSVAATRDEAAKPRSGESWNGESVRADASSAGGCARWRSWVTRAFRRRGPVLSDTLGWRWRRRVEQMLDLVWVSL